MILIDTGPLVALCDKRDSHHRRALKHLEACAAAQLVTCEAVLVETCVHLPNPAQRQRLRATLSALNVSAVNAGDRDFWLDVLDWLVKYADHQPGWADGCIAVSCGRDRTLTVWTYDGEFRTTWRRPDGSVIPLAVT